MDTDNTLQSTPVKNKQRFSIDLRWVVVLLVLIIGAMLVFWKPWEGDPASARTVQVQGEATVKAAPDEFIFYPGYKFENADKAVALADLTKRSDELVAGLKKLGVQESKIKTNSNGGVRDDVYAPEKEAGDSSIYTLQLTVVVNDEEMAQKVQDYLVGTSPVGAVSPQANFSDAKRKELEDKARTDALKDSKTKAEQSAQELGFKVGAVKTVTDGSFSIFSVANRGLEAADSTKSLPIHAGENELPYSVTVVYFIY